MDTVILPDGQVSKFWKEIGPMYDEHLDPPEEPHPIEVVLGDIARAIGEPKARENASTHDETNLRNDWIAIATAYLGRAADCCPRNQRESQDFRENMLKAAGVVVSAIVAHDEGHNAHQAAGQHHHISFDDYASALHATRLKMGATDNENIEKFATELRVALIGE